MEKYNLSDHGDLLEKEASSFIRSEMPFYETVWQLFIGNVGDATIAPLPKYPFEEKRVSFSEHSYSVLESSYMIQNILATNTLDAKLDSFKNYFEFNKAIIFFFTCLGRIHDNIIKAAEDINVATDKIREQLNQFYHARNIVIHGKRLPITTDDLGFLKIPVLENLKLLRIGWSDKGNNWSDVSELITDYAGDACGKYFNDLMTEVNNIYANFYAIIQKDLKSIPTSLTFTRNKLPPDIFEGQLPPSSGSSGVSGVPMDVYRLKEGIKGKGLF